MKFKIFLSPFLFCLTIGCTWLKSRVYTSNTAECTTEQPAGYASINKVDGYLSYTGNVDGSGSAVLMQAPRGIIKFGSKYYLTDGFSVKEMDVSNPSNVSIRNIAGVNYLSGAVDGVGAAARFGAMRGITHDGSYLYVVDSSQCAVRKIDVSTGEVTTPYGVLNSCGATNAIGTAARFSSALMGLTYLSGNLYVVDRGNYLIRKIDISTGAVTTLAGLAGAQANTDNAVGANVRFYQPYGIDNDGTNLYVIDPYLADGTLTQARFNKPHAMVKIGSDIFVADTFNHTIRKIDSSGNVTTIAGTAGATGTTDGAGTSALFNNPSDLMYFNGDLYVADELNNKIRKIINPTTAPSVSTYAGSGAAASTDGNGVSAAFKKPRSLANDGVNIYVSDANNYRIRKIDPAVNVTTFVGTTYGMQDAVGTAARFSELGKIVISNGFIYVYDSWNFRIRKVNLTTQEVSTFIGNGSTSTAEGYGTNIGLYAEADIGALAIDNDGQLLVGGYRFLFRSNLSTGLTVKILGTDYEGAGSSGVAMRNIYRPQYVTSHNCKLYTSDQKNNVIWKYDAQSGQRTVYAGTLGVPGDVMGAVSSSKIANPTGLYVDGDFMYIVSNLSSVIYKIDFKTNQISLFAGQIGVTGSADNINPLSGTFKNPTNICGNDSTLFIVDSGNHTIRSINKSTSQLSTLAGSASSSGSNNGVATSATFNNPQGCYATNTYLYIADSGNHTVRQIDLSTLNVSTLAGTAGSSGSANGGSISSQFYSPMSLWLNQDKLIVADYNNQLIRQINLSTNQVSTLVGRLYQQGQAEGALANSLVHYPNSLYGDSRGLFFIDGNSWTLRLISK